MSIKKTLFSVATITLISRLLSLVSNIVFMTFFGPQDVLLNMYNYALNIPNIMFNFIGTTISAVVVPIYSGLLTKEKNSNNFESKNFIQSIITLVCIITLVLIVIGFFISPAIASLTTFENTDFLIYTLRIMMIAMFFYGLNYVFQGILQSHQKFILPAFVSVPTSVVVIVYIVFFGEQFGVMGLVYATVIGLSLQAALLFPGVRNLSLAYRPNINMKDKNIKQALKLSIPVLLSVASFQINTLFNATIATNFYVVPIMMFVQNLMLVSILSLIYSIMSVYLPKLTSLWEEKKPQEYKTMLEDVLLITMFFLVPASFGMFKLSLPIINLISGWGNFDRYDVNLAAGMLSFYATGIISIGLKEVMDRAFYSKKDSKTPSIIGTVIMICNITISLIILNNFNEYTIPIAFAISTTIGTLCLIIIMNKSTKIFSKRFLVNVTKFFVSAIAMSLAIHISFRWFENVDVLGSELMSRIIELFIPFIIGFVTYMFFVIIFRVEQINYLVKLILNRFLNRLLKR